MADFLKSDIEEAKKRVREMQMRANSFIGADAAAAEAPIKEKNTESRQQPVKQTNDKDKQEKAESESGSEFIILIILLLLSHEGADNKLLLALLYLLL